MPRNLSQWESLSVFALRRTAKVVRFRASAIVSTLFALRTSVRSFCPAPGSKALVASHAALDVVIERYDAVYGDIENETGEIGDVALN